MNPIAILHRYSALQIEVSAFQAECASDLEVAEPVIQAAEKALNSLDKVCYVSMLRCKVVIYSETILYLDFCSDRLLLAS